MRCINTEMSILNRQSVKPVQKIGVTNSVAQEKDIDNDDNSNKIYNSMSLCAIQSLVPLLHMCLAGFMCVLPLNLADYSPASPHSHCVIRNMVQRLFSLACVCSCSCHLSIYLYA